MDFAIPTEIQDYLTVLDAFIEREIEPLERDHPQSLLGHPGERDELNPKWIDDPADTHAV